ncbi:hypothetical protein RDABS01_009164 [Bienertia sinuspersici]
MRKPLGVGSQQKMGTYLGCPMDCISSWKYSCLSTTGRCLLINSVQMALAAHIMSTYLFPKKILNRTNSTILRFYWGGPSIPTSVKNQQETRQPSGKNTFTELRREPLASGYGKVRKTHVIGVWKENRKWPKYLDLRRHLGRKLIGQIQEDYPRGQEETPKVVKDLMWGQGWNAAKCPEDTLNIYSQVGKEDETIWLLKQYGDYSVTWAIGLCKTGFSEKRWRNFCWKLVHNALPIRDNLVKRRMEVNQACFFCGEKETMDHLFINYEVTKRVWSSSTLRLRTPSCPTLDTSSWFKNMFIYLHKISDNHHQAWPSFVAILWAIWIHRNNITLKKRPIHKKF